MPIKINGQTTGSVTLTAPATGSDVSLTLPTLGFGKVLQVVMGSTATEASSSSTTYADTNLTASITPSSASSKVLVLVAQNGLFKSNGNAENAVSLRLLRDSTALVVFASDVGYTNSAGPGYLASAVTAYLDSPATTSAIAYKTQFKNFVAASNVKVQVGGAATSTIVLVEVGP